MAQNFIACDLEQELLLPPSLREWMPESHLAWFVLDAIGAMDLRTFFAGYRADGWGRATHDPAMMVALLLYAYATGDRSSRRIERRCHEDVAVRVIAANQAPDHTRLRAFVGATSGRSPTCSVRCWSCAPRRASCRSRSSPSMAPSCTPTRRCRATGVMSRSRARSWPRRRKPTAWKTRTSVIGGATSCRRSSPRRRAAAAGCAKPSAASTSAAPKRRGRFRRRDRRRSRKPSAVWKKSSGPSAKPTPPMRPIARAGG